MIKKILSFFKYYFLKIALIVLIITFSVLLFLLSQNVKDISLYPTENLLSEKYSSKLEKKADYITGKNIHLKYNNDILLYFVGDITT